MNISSIDLQLQLQFGKDIKAFDNVFIKPYKLKEIVDYGYSKYESILRWISLDLDSLINSIEDLDKREELIKVKDKMTTFDFYSRLGGNILQQQMLLGLSMIFRTDDVIYSHKNRCVYINFAKEGLITIKGDSYADVEETKDIRTELLEKGVVVIINRDNFDKVIDVVRLQNYLQKVEDKNNNEINPANEETRLLMEQMAKMREKVNKIKKEQSQQEDGEVDFASIVSAVGSKSNSINRLNIGELTIFEIYDEYSRLELIESYNINIQAMMNGAENVKNKHWSTKL